MSYRQHALFIWRPSETTPFEISADQYKFAEIAMEAAIDEGARDPFDIVAELEEHHGEPLGKPPMAQVHLIHTRMQDVAKLEEIFAKLTDDGWVIPPWLVYMRKACVLNS